MMKWKLAVVVVWLVLASPYILLNVWGIRVTSLASDFINDLNQDTSVDAQVAADGVDTTAPKAAELRRITIPPGHAGVWTKRRGHSIFQTNAQQEQQNVELQFSPTALSSERRITIHEQVALETLLKDGEAAPDPAFAKLTAMMRVPEYLMSYCEDVVPTIGNRCAVGKVTVNGGKDGVYNVSSWLGYAPSYDMGKVTLSESANIVSTSLVKMMPDAKMHELPPNTAEGRQLTLQMAVDACDYIKQQFGNCVIDVMTMQQRTIAKHALDKLPPRTAPVRLKSSVSVTVYIPYAPDAELKLQKALEDYAEKST